MIFAHVPRDDESQVPHENCWLAGGQAFIAYWAIIRWVLKNDPFKAIRNAHHLRVSAFPPVLSWGHSTNGTVTCNHRMRECKQSFIPE
jgi:hypothetical protein